LPSVKNLTPAHNQTAFSIVGISMNNKRIFIGLVVVVILLIPYLLNAPWTFSDYVVAAILLSGTGFMFDLVTNKIKDHKKKIIAGLGVLFVAMYIWAELAVGIFTSIGS
jgi:membrane-associated HD superfamily phosphohydrolase